MRLSHAFAYLRFLRSPTLRSADDEALGVALLGVALLGHARAAGDGARLGLVVELARLSGRRSASVSLGSFLVDGARVGPWTLRLEPRGGEDAGSEPPPLAAMVSGDGARPPLIRSGSAATGARNLFRAVRVAASLSRDTEWRIVDAATLGASLRPVLAPVEAAEGGRSALFLGLLLASALVEAVRSRAATMTVSATDASAGDAFLGSWSATLSRAGQSSADEPPSRRQHHGVVDDADPAPERAMQARRFRRISRLTELGVTYRRGTGGGWLPVRVEFRGDPAGPPPAP